MARCDDKREQVLDMNIFIDIPLLQRRDKMCIIMCMIALTGKQFVAVRQMT